jgi:hypothetical protein
MKPEKSSFTGKLTFLFILVLVAVVPTVGQAATFNVNSTADVAGLQANCISGVGQCTLRSAIQAANASLTVADTINLPPGTYNLTIPGRNENVAATGDLDITGIGANGLTIVGTGATPGATVIDGSNNDRIFDIIGNAPVSVSNVTIQHGNSGGVVGGAILTGGGGIQLTLNNVIISNNTSGLANVEGDAISIGGGGATVTMTNVAIVNNGPVAPGGGNIIGIGAAPTALTITNGTISNNTDTAIGNAGILKLTNVTMSGNQAINAAAIDNNKATGTVALQNCTINGNVATAVGNVGGIRNLAAAANVTARNTIISNNAPVNCNVAVTSLGNNLATGTTCIVANPATADVVADPLLNPLALNGAAFLTTHATLAGSPAIDTGSATGCPATDARGVARPVDGNIPLDGVATCDKGAFEFRPQKITVTLPPPFDFGTVTSATTSDHTITLGNAGDGALNIGAIATADPLAAPFSIPVNTCSSVTLALGATCTVTTRFAPTAAVLSLDNFDIPSNDPLTPAITFGLTGTGTAIPVPGISVTDSIPPATDQQIPFGGVTVGSSADATVTIANTGTADLVLGTIASANPIAAPFSILSDTCSGKTVAPTATCTLTVHFAPTADGAASDTFDIPSNVAGSATLTMTVNGTGGLITTPVGTPTGTTGGTTGTTTGTINTPPTPPDLVFPADAQTGLGTTVTFIWNKSVDPGEVVKYQLIYSTDQNLANPQTIDVVPTTKTAGLVFAGLGSMGGGILMFGFVAGNGFKRSRNLLLAIPLILMGALFTACGGGGGGGSEASIPTADQASTTVSGLAANTTYYWKVVASDSKGGQSSSAIRSFKTQ